jgi:hypothetical protein
MCPSSGHYVQFYHAEEAGQVAAGNRTSGTQAGSVVSGLNIEWDPCELDLAKRANFHITLLAAVRSDVRVMDICLTSA